jgi:hypothetical protein
MRRSLILAGALCLLFAGCGPMDTQASANDEIDVTSAQSNLVIGSVEPRIYTHISIDPSVVGMALNSAGTAYTWYRDGTATAGSLTNLDDKRSPYYFATPPGKTPYDIVAMAINSGDRVYTWYKDGTRSVGTSSDLDAYQAPRAYALPFKSGSTTRYTPSEIVDITISAQDRVRTFYSDGMLSSGNSLDLGASYANVAYQAANGRSPKSILGIAQLKSTNEVVSWYRDGYVAKGTTFKLGGAGEPYSQHLTIYSFKTGLAQSEPNSPIFEGPGPVQLVRGDLGPIHEAIVAPGSGYVATAQGSLSIFKKTGERVLNKGSEALFADYLAESTDPVRNINTFAGLGDCVHGYPQTTYGQGFCVFQTYDTRAAFDQVGQRFVFLAAARNYAWEIAGDNGECIAYRDASDKEVRTKSYCGSARRYVMLAVSVSENPADGFHLYAIKEANYRDWPTLAVNGNQLIVAHKNAENPDGYVAIVFDLEQMRKGARRPRYFKLYKDDIEGNLTLSVPRMQDGKSVLTLGIASNGNVFGFSKTAVGYGLPTLLKGNATLPVSENWNFSKGLLRLAKSVSAVGGANKLQYGRYPVTTSATQITVETSAAKGAIPYGDLFVPSSKMKSFDCARLAVTPAGDEVIAFAGVRGGSGTTVTYDAAFVARPYGQSAFNAPVAYATGTYADPSSSNSSSGLTYNTGHCQQQGGAERDPEGWRVWMMHSYGLEGSGLSLRGALGWVSFR